MQNRRTKLRKGRCLLVLCLPILFVCVCLGNNKAQAENCCREYKQVRVYAGDTLWDIVEDNCEGDYDIRSMIRRVKKENHLCGRDAIYPGEILNIPIN